MSIENILGFTSKGFKNLVYSTVFSLGLSACTGSNSATQIKNEEGYSANDNGYQLNDIDLRNDTKDINNIFEVDTFTNAFVDIFIDTSISRNDGTTIEDLLNLKDNTEKEDNIVESDIPDVLDIPVVTDVPIVLDVADVFDIPIVTKYTVKFIVSNAYNNKKLEDIAVTLYKTGENVNTAVATTTNIEGIALFNIPAGDYDVFVEDDDVSAGDYKFQFDELIIQGISELELENFNLTVIGSFFDRVEKITVSGNNQLLEEMIPNEQINILKNDGVLTYRNFLEMFGEYTSTNPATSNYTFLVKWKTDTIKTYVSEGKSFNGKIDYKLACLDAMNELSNIIGLELFQIVNSQTQATNGLIIKYDGEGFSKTEINFNHNVEPWVIVNSYIHIEQNMPDQKEANNTCLYHLYQALLGNSANGKDSENTIAGNPKLGTISEQEGKIVNLFFKLPKLYDNSTNKID